LFAVVQFYSNVEKKPGESRSVADVYVPKVDVTASLVEVVQVVRIHPHNFFFLPASRTNDALYYVVSLDTHSYAAFTYDDDAADDAE
jgi:hypothetical protein